MTYSVLRSLGSRLRGRDLTARYGGEEFAVVLVGASLELAVHRLQQLLQDFSELVHTGSAGAVFSCTFSAGVASYVMGDTTDGLLNRADTQLYEAKRLGRNRVVAATEQALAG